MRIKHLMGSAQSRQNSLLDRSIKLCGTLPSHCQQRSGVVAPAAGLRYETFFSAVGCEPRQYCTSRNNATISDHVALPPRRTNDFPCPHAYLQSPAFSAAAVALTSAFRKLISK